MTIKHYILPVLFSVIIAVGCKKKESPKVEEPPVVVTPSLTPELTTAAISGITDSTAMGGGNITSGGTSAVMAVGVCWDTLPAPTTLRNLTNNGAGTGTYISKLTGLQFNKKYYVRAYATNFNGTSYGNEVSFTMPSGWAKTTPVNMSSYNFHCLTGDGASIFAGTSSGVIFSADSGATWASGGWAGEPISKMIYQSGYIYIARTDGIYRSNTNGGTWAKVYSLTSQVNITCFAGNGSQLYASTNSNFMLISQNGSSWTIINSNIQLPAIGSIAASGPNLCATTGYSGLLISSDNGSNWTSPNSFPGCGGSGGACYLFGIAISGNNVFVGSSGSASQSNDNGSSWFPNNTLEKNTSAFSTSGTDVLAVNGTGKVQFSHDNGNTWGYMSTKGINGTFHSASLIMGNYLYVASFNNGIFRKKR